MPKATLELGPWALFVEVVDAGSLSSAARRLGVTKSSVSKRISRIEEQLGVALLQRNARPLAMTEAGERFYAHAREGMESLRCAERAVAELREQPRGTLRVIAPMSLGRLVITPLLAPFLRRYPQLRLDLVLDDRRRPLFAGDFDLAVRGGPLPDSSLIARKLGDLSSVLCASPAYVREHGAPRSPAQLAKHNCLDFSASTSAGTWTFMRTGKSITVPVVGNATVDNSEALCGLVRDGLGVCRLPAFVAAPYLEDGSLVALLRGYRMPTAPLHVIYPQRRFLPHKTRLFLEHLVHAFGA